MFLTINKREWKRIGLGLLFVSPWLVGYLVFLVYPLLSSLYDSFTDDSILSPPHWVGLQNYSMILGSDDVFRQAVGNTLYFTALSIVLGTTVSLMLALLLHSLTHLASLFRTVFFLPSILPAVAGTVLWLWVLNPQYGVVNQFLRLVRIAPPAWFSDPHWSVPGLVLLGIWTSGSSVVIYLSALNGLPKDVYESAALDGANGVMTLLRITIPLLSPIIFFSVVLGVIGGLQTFTQGYVAGGSTGSPAGSLFFYGMYLFEQAFSLFHMGYASALAWILFVITALSTVVVTRTLGRYTYYEV